MAHIRRRRTSAPSISMPTPIASAGRGARMTRPFRDRTGAATCYRKEIQRMASHMRRVYLGEEEFEPFVAPAGGPDRRACGNHRAERRGS